MTDSTNETDRSPGLFFTTVFTLPNPWPPIADIKALGDAGSGMVILWTTDGRVRVQVRDPQGLILAEGVSARIQKGDAGTALGILLVSWSGEQSEVIIRINGSPTNAESEPILLGGTPDPDNFISHTVVEQGSEEKRKERSVEAAKFRLQNFDEQRQAEDLEREVRLLGKALDRLKAGDDDEIVTVSTTLRKMILKGRGNHALQDYAGLKSLHLDVWSMPPPSGDNFTLEKFDPLPEFWWKGAFANEKHWSAPQRMDLDYWLDLNGGTISGKLTTNRSILHGIADKIGAHLDTGPRVTVDRLALTTVFNVNLARKHLLDLGNAVLVLARNTLEAGTRSRTPA